MEDPSTTASVSINTSIKRGNLISPQSHNAQIVKSNPVDDACEKAYDEKL